MEECLNIPIKFNDDGTAKVTKNLLAQYHLICLEDCQRAAHERYGKKFNSTDAQPSGPFKAKNLDPANNKNDEKQFYKKVRSNVVAKLSKMGSRAQVMLI